MSSTLNSKPLDDEVISPHQTKNSIPKYQNLNNTDYLKQALLLNNKINQKNEDGFFQLSYDQEAISAYEKYVDANFGTHTTGLAKIKWLIEHNFYVSDLLKNYTDEQVQSLIDDIYSYDFKWKNYMSITKFYEAYVLKSDDGSQFLERFQDRVIVVALFLHKNDINLATQLANYMVRHIYQPATPTFANAGKKRSGEFVSCFLLEVDDSLNSINYIIATSMQLSKIGGGVAINLSRLRSKGASIKNIAAAASGVIPILKILENVFDYADQLGVRRGSGAVYLSIFHHDLVDFIDCKKINSDEKSRIQTLSLGLLIPNKFIDLAKQNSDFYIFEPHTVWKKYKEHLGEMDMDKWYDILAKDDDIIKTQLSSRAVLNKIAQSQFESGYPYIIFLDNANQNNPLQNIGKIKMSNLCTEIFQIQEASEINDYGVQDNIKRDVSCILGSLNIVNVFKDKKLEEIVHAAMEALSSVTDISSISNAPGIKKANKELHSVGLGAMNFTGFLIKNSIPYESDYCLEFADVFFAAMNYYSILASAKIAKNRNKSFEGFENSDYANGKYFKQYVKNEYLPKSEKITKIFEGMKLPTKKDWEELSVFVAKHGLYNAYRLAIAPTQSISYLHGATASVTPIISPVEIRMFGKSVTYFPMPFLSEKNFFLYKSAYNIDQMKIIDVAATIQKHIDQGISTVLYVTNQTSTRELAKLYLYAHHKKLKSLYYTRTKNLEINECLSCAA